MYNLQKTNNSNMINTLLKSAPETAIIIIAATPCIIYVANKVAKVANNAIDKNCGFSCGYKEFNLVVNPSI